MSEARDVLILGGGLAGMTLALQLRQRHPQLDIEVVERREHPVPEAAHKVGESTVEIGAHYFAETLGLKPMLAAEQLRKFGFRFFFSDRRSDIDNVTEIGASRFLPTGSWQIDRGIFENSLARHVAGAGVVYSDRSVVRSLEPGARGAPHSVVVERDGVRREIRSRWLVDASGRAGLLKRKLDLAEPSPHEANAVWFRIAARINVDDWSSDAEFLGRCDPPHRWLSTIHLVGEGYWVWLIPLSSGSHSVGIVCDPKRHPIERMDSFEAAMQWFSEHQPRLYRELDGKRDKLQDFAYFKRFSYGCKRLFNGADRWAITGEAGVFLDPFYSPGSDFIAISNSMVSEIISQDRQRGSGDMHASLFERIYKSLYEGMLPLYVGQYDLFRDATIMPLKVFWDYAFYWGVMCPLFIQGKLTDVIAMSRLTPRLERVQALNVAVQNLFRRWGEHGPTGNPRRMIDQASVPWFAEMNRALADRLDGPGFEAGLNAAIARLSALAAEIVWMAERAQPGIDAEAVRGLLGEAHAPREPELLAALQ